MHLALIGYRGTGKTTVAQVLARELGLPWIDADVELERRAGRTIRQIFAEEGEGAFRDLEEAVLVDLAQGAPQILALGGGVILRESNRRVLRASAQTAWLTASPQTIFERINACTTSAERRPNLTAAGGLEEIETLLAAREPLYRECADCIVATDGRTPESIAGEIVARLGPALGRTK